MNDPDIRRLMYSDESDEEDLIVRILDDEMSIVESDPELRSRQLAYPPLPVYESPASHDVKDTLGLLTPMEELSESDGGSFVSSRHNSAFQEPVDRVRRVSFSPARNEPEDPGDDDPELQDILDGSRSPSDDAELIQARHERVRNWQEKHHYSEDEFSHFLSTAEVKIACS